MSETFQIDGPAGGLQARWTPAESPRSIAVVAHPHPLYGGTMDNAVVRTAESVLVQGGTSVLRFNFRGVGRSAGQHDGGVGEVADLAAAEDAALARAPALPLWLVGYSFGAVVAALRLGEQLGRGGDPSGTSRHPLRATDAGDDRQGARCALWRARRDRTAAGDSCSQ